MTGYLTANDTPGHHAPSWYAETAGEMPEHPPLAGETRADVCVIGGGFAGLSAALHLAEAGLAVVLLEANRIGWGASGRNGGQLASAPRAPMEDHARALGRDDARSVMEIALEANALVRRLAAIHAIDCDLRDGHLECAAKPGHAREILDWAESAGPEWGHPGLRPVARDEVKELLGTDRYFAGALDTVAGHLHPLKLALGLGRAAAAAGVRIHEASLVTRVGGGRIDTAQGTVRAGQVIVACNGYLDGLVPRVARRSMPINNFIVATEPLAEDTAGRINPRNLAVSDSLFVLNYFRMTPDRRLLWGGGESYGRRFPRDIVGLVRKSMARVYPELASLGVTHAWGGTLAITGTRMPAFQTLGTEGLAISGWSGSGVHMAVMGGAIAAEAISGRMARWDLLSRLPTPPFPGGSWFRTPLLAAAMTWYSLRDRL